MTDNASPLARLCANKKNGRGRGGGGKKGKEGKKREKEKERRVEVVVEQLRAIRVESTWMVASSRTMVCSTVLAVLGNTV